MGQGLLLQAGLAASETPIEIREQAARRFDEDPTGRQRLAEQLDGVIFLSTCQRLELISVVNEPASRQAVSDWLGTLLGDAAHARRYVRMCGGVAAARRFFRVTAGLESNIVGEPHVLGQVKRAYQMSQEAGMLSPVISALGRSAVSCGKRVRSETALNRRKDSIVTLVRDYLKHALGDTAGRRVVVLGTGVLARELTETLTAAGSAVQVVSLSSFERARQVTAVSGGSATPYVRLHRVIAATDAVVAATRPIHGTISADMFRRRPHTHTLPVIDLSVPRIFDEHCRKLPGIRMCDLQSFSAGRDDADALHRAEQIVDEELARFANWRRSRLMARHIDEIIRCRGGHAANASRSGSREIHEHIMRIKAGAAA